MGAPDASRCFFNGASGKARLEPPEGSFFLGFSPLWINGELPQDIKSRLGGFSPPLFNSFIALDPKGFSPNLIEWNCQLVAEMGGILELTLQPTMKASEIPEGFYDEFALFARKMNEKYGIGILLRFMHEMNGNWMPYGLQPTAQKKAFGKLSKALRKQTNMTALVWSPNISVSFKGETKRNPGLIAAEDFDILDTDRNGVLNANDDPYEAFYPGRLNCFNQR